MKAAASVTIDKQIAECFTAFADLNNRSKFIPSVTELKVLTPDWSGRGVTWEESRFTDGTIQKARMTVTEYKPPRILVIDSHSMGITFRIRYNFQPEGPSSTKIVTTIGGEQKGFIARLMKRFLSDNTEYVHGVLQQELDAFKALMEKDQD